MKVSTDSDELSLYISSTGACLTKLINELSEKDFIDVERLESYIKFQQSTCVRLQSTIDNLPGRSKNG